MTQNGAEILADLVAIPSVNPMGMARTGGELFEDRVTDYLEKFFKRLDLPFLRQEVHPNRENIVAWIEGSTPAIDGGETIILEVHQDTVPVDGMTIDPWKPVVADGKLYGRGACDVKGGMAAMLVALSRLACEKPAGMPTVLLACSVNEEHGFSGATALCRMWQENGPKPPFAKRPAACIVAEPTELNIVVAHKGAIRWKCRTTGRAAHSSHPDQGDNSIYKMSRVVVSLARYANDEVGHLAEHPICGRPTLSVGTIIGGISVNTVPESCVIEIDRRLCPGEDPDGARQNVIDYLKEAKTECEHDPPFISGRGLQDTDNEQLAERLAAAASACGTSSQAVGVAYATDATAIAASGVPTVVFGPGSIDQAHTADEWIELAQVNRAAEILFRFCADFAAR